ncbi:hypothetical protein EKPJFOCH_1399 [Methylobacterium thuringiense]|uniref:Ribokinase n=1 Tax=Methylobacterium thuringiense TaxID=1003091 RepID=A0ABQ4TI59_9HYPH|nr:hypothetical protein EKPJFOCH_1399 [Methylobacterium thuringiense]
MANAVETIGVGDTFVGVFTVILTEGTAFTGRFGLAA